jgi:Domain of unknown function (DUF6265)
MFQKITLLLLFSVFFSCKNNANKNDKIKAAQWLIGKWENKSKDGNLEETWKKVNDSTLQATSYFIKEGDTLHYETVILQQNGEDLIYNATVQGQNDDKAVAFKLNTEIEKQLVFENLKHDYPQKISYTQVTKDSLLAKITGIIDGKATSEQFPMKKKE